MHVTGMKKIIAGNHPNPFTIVNGPNLSEGFFHYFVDVETFFELAEFK